jgi:hypothetical protein
MRDDLELVGRDLLAAAQILEGAAAAERQRAHGAKVTGRRNERLHVCP